MVTGEVLKAEWRSNQWGDSFKMLFKDDRGFKLWGSVPRSLEEAAKRGVRIEFTATLEQSEDDPLFGFFKRPSKAKVL